MAQETRPRSVSRSFSEEEWEAQKERFRILYLDKGMSLREAAQCMKEQFGFDATPRQWERRIAPDKWGFQKYESRDARLQQIQASGRSLLEVSSRGRRKSTASDGRPTQTEDRNMRRFARREVSRDARRRARSVSEVSDFSDRESSAGSMPGTPGQTYSSMQDLGGQFEQGTTFGNNLSVPTWPASVGAGDHINLFDPGSQMGGAVVPQILISDDSSHLNAVNSQNPFGITGGGDMLSFGPQQQQFADMNDNSQPTDSNFENALLTQTLSSYEPGWNDSYDMANGTGNPPPTLTESMSFDQDPGPSSFPEMMESMISPPMAPASFEVVNPDFNFNSPPPGHVMQERGSVDIDPYGDPVHADVHALLGAHTGRIDDVVQSCMNDVQSATNLATVFQHLKVLRFRLQAQNQESHREISMTLKNISSTQQRANQSVRDLCSNLRKKNDALKSQNNALMSMVHSNNSGAQASFSPTHQVQNPWQMG